MNSALQQIATKLPPLEPCSTVPLPPDRLLVHSPGFEDRTMSIVNLASPSPGSKALLLDYRPFNAKNRLNEVRSGLQQKGVHIAYQDILVYDRFAPADFEQRLSERICAAQARGILLDISTMSKLAIILILRTCLELDLEVDIVYSAAEHYGPTEEEFRRARDHNNLHQPTLQIFTGVHGVVRVGSLASVAMQGQPTAALVFMSFNDLLTQVLLNTVYPTRLFLINGNPPKLKWREEATAWIHEQVRKEWADDNPVIEIDGKVLPSRTVSTLDYRETFALLTSLYWQLSAQYRILLAPAGSKMQSVGSFFVKALHPDIHIEYPSPEGFLEEYSSGIADSWVLRCGKLSRLLKTLQAAEFSEFLELAPGFISR